MSQVKVESQASVKLRSEIEIAKDFRAEKIAEAEATLRDAQVNIAAAQERIELWRKMPLDYVLLSIQEEWEEEKGRSSEALLIRSLEDSHDAALKASVLDGKGILPPDSMKCPYFGFLGAGIFAMCFVLITRFAFGVSSEIWLYLSFALGFAVGLYAGWEFFSANFVVDKSLSRFALSGFKLYRNRADQLYPRIWKM